MCCIAQAAHGVKGSIQCRIEADRHISAVHIVVDRGRNAYDGQAELLHLPGAAERTIASDHDKTVDFVLLALTQSLAASFRSHEAIASGRAKQRASALNDRTDVAHIKGTEKPVDQAFISLFYAETF